MIRSFCGNQSPHFSHPHIDPSEYAVYQSQTMCPGWPTEPVQIMAREIARAVDNISIDQWNESSVDYKREFFDGAFAALECLPISVATEFMGE